MTYCTQCGEKNPDTTKFCMKCGAVLPVSKPAQPARPAAPSKPTSPSKPVSHMRVGKASSKENPQHEDIKKSIKIPRIIYGVGIVVTLLTGNVLGSILAIIFSVVLYYADQKIDDLDYGGAKMMCLAVGVAGIAAGVVGLPVGMEMTGVPDVPGLILNLVAGGYLIYAHKLMASS